MQSSSGRSTELFFTVNPNAEECRSILPGFVSLLFFLPWEHRPQDCGQVSSISTTSRAAALALRLIHKAELGPTDQALWGSSGGQWGRTLKHRGRSGALRASWARGTLCPCCTSNHWRFPGMQRPQGGRGPLPCLATPYAGKDGATKQENSRRGQAARFWPPAPRPSGHWSRHLLVPAVASIELQSLSYTVDFGHNQGVGVGELLLKIITPKAVSSQPNPAEGINLLQGHLHIFKTPPPERQRTERTHAAPFQLQTLLSLPADSQESDHQTSTRLLTGKPSIQRPREKRLESGIHRQGH